MESRWSGGMPTLAWACPGDRGRSSSHGHTSVAMPPTLGVAATERSEVDGALQGCRHGPSTSPFGFSGCHPTDSQAPTSVIPTAGPKARSGGIRSNSPSTRHPTRSRNSISAGWPAREEHRVGTAYPTCWSVKIGEDKATQCGNLVNLGTLLNGNAPEGGYEYFHAIMQRLQRSWFFVQKWTFAPGAAEERCKGTFSAQKTGRLHVCIFPHTPLSKGSSDSLMVSQIDMSARDLNPPG